MTSYVVSLIRNVKIKYILLIFQVHKNLILNLWKQTHERKVQGKEQARVIFRQFPVRRKTHNFLRMLLRIYCSKRT